MLEREQKDALITGGTSSYLEKPAVLSSFTLTNLKAYRELTNFN